MKPVVKVNVCYCLVIMAICISYILSTVSNNAFIVLAMLGLAFIIKHSFIISITHRLDKNYVYLFLFAIYCFISSFWAKNVALSKQAGFSYILCVVIALVIIETCYDSKKNVFHAIYISGFFIGLYTIYSYGILQIIQSIFGIHRIENTFCNVNLLGLLFAYTILVSCYKIIFINKKSIIDIFIVFIDLVLLLSTQSIKALFFVIIGIFGLTYLKYSHKVKWSLFFKYIAIAICMIWGLYYLSTLSAFSFAKARTNGIVSVLTGIGNVTDGSAMLRKTYIGVGIEQFKKHKLLGIGMDNARIALGLSEAHRETYLHNNYVELLCDGGITGLILYYSFHLNLLVGFIRNKKYWTTYSKFCLFFLLLMLIMDYGMVSYSEKCNWIALTPVIIEVRRLCRNRDHTYKKEDLNFE